VDQVFRMLASVSTVLVINECLILLFDTVTVTGVYNFGLRLLESETVEYFRDCSTIQVCQ
jgi:hypothetical protein